MKKKWLGVMGLAVLSMFSVPSGAITGWNMTDTFQPAGPGSETATVHSWVEELVTAQVYRYNYEIDSTLVNINWFSVELLPNAGVTGSKGTAGTGSIPLVWDFVDTPPSSIAAFFQSQITISGNSCVMWFDSYQPPMEAGAMVSGITGRTFNSLTGTVYTPIPEPTTMTVFALGLGLIARKKK